MCPITSKPKGYPFEVRVDGHATKGVVLSDQIKSLDWRARGARFEERADEDVRAEVAAKIDTLIKV